MPLDQQLVSHAPAAASYLHIPPRSSVLLDLRYSLYHQTQDLMTLFVRRFSAKLQADSRYVGRKCSHLKIQSVCCTRSTVEAAQEHKSLLAETRALFNECYD